MKSAWTGLIVALLAAPGCTWPMYLQLTGQPPAPPVVVEPPKPRGPISPERVTPANAHQAADALSDELDRAAKESVFK